MNNTQLEEIKKGKRIFEGDLDLEGYISLKSLPEGLSVGKDLWLKGCTYLTSLPEGLTVGGGLGLEDCTSLKSLPENLKVGGNLICGGCSSLTSLPKKLKIKRNIYLTENLNKQVIEDAEKAKEEKRIKREVIIY